MSIAYWINRSRARYREKIIAEGRKQGYAEGYALGYAQAKAYNLGYNDALNGRPRRMGPGSRAPDNGPSRRPINPD